MKHQSRISVFLGLGWLLLLTFACSTNENPEDTCVLFQPENLMVSDSQPANLTWDTLSEADLYYIYRNKDDGDFQLLASTEFTSYRDETVFIGGTYQYYITARIPDQCDETGTSEWVSLEAEDCPYFDKAPIINSVSIDDSSGIHLSWNPKFFTANYLIYRAVTPSGSYTLIETTTESTFQDTTITQGESAYYKLQISTEGCETPLSSPLYGYRPLNWDSKNTSYGTDLKEYLAYKQDDSDTHHLAYTNTSNELVYLKGDGTTWSQEIVDTDVNTWGIDMTLDSNQHPHLVYGNKTNTSLFYAAWNGSSWVLEEVDATGTTGRFPSITLDNNDYPHIAYDTENPVDGQANPDGSLNYALYNGTSWERTTIASSPNQHWQHTAIALDSTQLPYIAFPNFGTGCFQLAQFNGSSWNIQDVDCTTKTFTQEECSLENQCECEGTACESDGVKGGHASMMIESDGNIHISYLARHYLPMSDGNLKYAFWDGSTWTITEVDRGSRCGWSTTLLLDEKNHPHIVYEEAGLPVITNNVRYARYDGATWHYGYAFPNSNAGDGTLTRAAFSSLGALHIFYYYDGSIHHAY